MLPVMPHRTGLTIGVGEQRLAPSPVVAGEDAA